MRGNLWLLLYSLAIFDYLRAHYINDFDKANAFNKFCHGVYMADDSNATYFNQCTIANMDFPVLTPLKIRATILSYCAPMAVPLNF